MFRFKELVMWVLALCYLKWVGPAISVVSFCLFEWIGIPWCPGRGLGRSIHYFLNGDILSSLDYHLLGIPTTIVICYRILQIVKYEIAHKRKSSYLA